MKTKELSARVVRELLFVFILASFLIVSSLNRVHHVLQVQEFSAQVGSDLPGVRTVSPSTSNRVLPTSEMPAGVVLTSWFVKKKDPQLNATFASSDIDGYIANFYNSVRRWNLTTVIVHDHLSEQVAAQYETDRVIFHRIDWTDIEDERTKEYSTNDYRFVVYRNLLHQHKTHDDQESRHGHPSASHLVQNAPHLLMMDSRDGFFQRDPFSILQKSGMDMLLSPDLGIYGETRYNDWIRNKLKECMPNDDMKLTMHGAWKGKPICNAGVWGGTRDSVSCMLDCYDTQLRRIHDPTANCNMAIHNYCTYEASCGSFRVETDPFVNPFTSECRNSSYAIIHNKCKESEHTICLAPKTLEVTSRQPGESCPVDTPNVATASQ